MKKTFTALFVLILAMSLCIGVFAQSSTVTGTVTFDGKKLNTSYTNAEFLGQALALQPGDDITYTITLKNNYSQETEWWMYNRVLESFEDNSSAKGGAYTYHLEYSGPNNSRVLYDSDTVGGETAGNEGLTSATSALRDYFVLGTLKMGQSATVTLRVKLDGETQTNNYQDTLADLNMRYAVEIVPTDDIVKTGDETEILPYVIGAAVSGALLMVIAVARVKTRKQHGKGKA